MSDAIQALGLDQPEEIDRAFAVFTFLRPHLDAATFAQRVRAQAAEGYRIVFIERAGRVVAAGGYRVATFLAWGRVLYIDDLITHPDDKRQGHGGALLDWLIAEARRLGCDEVHLDTGFTRHDAHRLYLNKGFKLACHHMSLPIAKTAGA